MISTPTHTWYQLTRGNRTVIYIWTGVSSGRIDTRRCAVNTEQE